jgi:hypothetical protein
MLDQMIYYVDIDWFLVSKSSFQLGILQSIGFFKSILFCSCFLFFFDKINLKISKVTEATNLTEPMLCPVVLGLWPD